MMLWLTLWLVVVQQVPSNAIPPYPFVDGPNTFPPGFVVTPAAQQVTPLNSVPPNPTAAWTQDAETLQEVQGYIYRYYLDGAQTGAAFGGVACSGTARPWSCTAPLPVTLGGEHTVTMTAELTTGEKGPMSAPTTFTIELLGAPTSPAPVIIIK